MLKAITGKYWVQISALNIFIFPFLLFLPLSNILVMKEHSLPGVTHKRQTAQKQKAKMKQHTQRKSLNPASGNEGGKLTTSGCLMIDYAYTQDHNIGYTISFDTESRLTDYADSYICQLSLFFYTEILCNIIDKISITKWKAVKYCATPLRHN